MSDPAPLPTVRAAVKDAIAESRATGVAVVPVTAASDPQATSAMLRGELVLARWWASNKYTIVGVLIMLYGSMEADHALGTVALSVAWLETHWWPFLLGQIVIPGLRAINATRVQNPTTTMVVNASRA